MRNVKWAEERRNKKKNRKKEAKVRRMSITCGRRRGKALQKTRMFRRG